MKKLFVSIAVLLLCCPSFSQEAEAAGNSAVISFIPRLDLEYSGDEFSFGNSSFYTLFEGNVSDHFSWTLCNHWYQYVKGESSVYLYKELLHSNATNLFDYACVDLNFGNWSFNLGKNCLTLGTFEFEDWDYDVMTLFASPLWNNSCSYQWGAQAMYTLPSEAASFSLQMKTSPFGERPFASGLYSYSAQIRWSLPWLSSIWSASALEEDKGKFGWIFSVGEQAALGDFTITLDWSNSAGMDLENNRVMAGHTVKGTAGWTGIERLNLSLIGMWSKIESESGFLFGPVCQYSPFKNESLAKLHLMASYNTLLKSFGVNFGIRFNIQTGNLL